MDTFPNDRCWEIIDMLLDAVNPITISATAEKLNVSNRTIRNDLEIVGQYLKESNLGEIVKKPRVGIWIKADQENRIWLRNAVNKSKMHIHPYSAEERQYFIIRRLMLSNGHISIQDLADEIYVSKVTIYKDMEKVEKWLKKYNLTLKTRRNSGIEITGDEKNWRKAAADLMVILKNDEEIKNILLTDNNKIKSSRIGYEYFGPIEEMFPDIDFLKIEGILVQAENNMRFLLTDEAFAGLVIHIAISIERVRQKKDIKVKSKYVYPIDNQKEYEIAKYIAENIEKGFNIKLPEPEIGYIMLHILGAKVQEDFQSNEIKAALDNTDEKIVHLAKEIIAMIGNILSVDFSKDEKLLNGLILHLRPAINRLKYGMTLRNPLLAEIKNKYSSVYGAAWTTSVLFEKFYGIKVTEEEIGYIALHIGAALVRLDKKTRAVIVCSSGIGTSQLVAERLRKEISELEIVDITSIYALEKTKLTDFDIILSTVPLTFMPEKLKSKPLINISVFVTEKDIANIKKYIVNIQNTRKFDNRVLNTNNIDFYFEDLTFVSLDLKTKDEVLDYMSSKLESNGYVKSGFKKTVFERENIISTAVGKGIAIPHGDVDFIIKPSIAIATLKSPIDWAGDMVDVVFMLAFSFKSGNDLTKFFKKFYSVIDDESVVDSIRNLESEAKIYNYLTRGDI